MKCDKLDILLERVKEELIELLNSFEETVINSQVEDDCDELDYSKDKCRVLYNEKDVVIPLVTLTENYSEMFIEKILEIIEEIEEE
jgi:hypothetical protein